MVGNALERLSEMIFRRDHAPRFVFPLDALVFIPV